MYTKRNHLYLEINCGRNKTKIKLKTLKYQRFCLAINWHCDKTWTKQNEYGQKY